MFSCHTTRYIPMPSSHTRDSTHLSVYTRADSIREYVHDSMSIRFAAWFTSLTIVFLILYVFLRIYLRR